MDRYDIYNNLSSHLQVEVKYNLILDVQNLHSAENVACALFLRQGTIDLYIVLIGW